MSDILKRYREREKSKSKKAQLTVRIRAELKERLEAEAAKDGSRPAELIEFLLEQAFREDGDSTSAD